MQTNFDEIRLLFSRNLAGGRSVILQQKFRRTFAEPHENSNAGRNFANITTKFRLEFVCTETDIQDQGDFNPNSTNILSPIFKRMTGLTQMIKVLTRDSGILDWCLTNRPKTMAEPKQLPKVGRSDHYCVLIQQTNNSSEPVKRTTSKRDTRSSRIRDFGRWITSFSWDEVFLNSTCEGKFSSFYNIITSAVDKFLPVKSCRVSDCDRPWLTHRVKSLIEKR